MEGLIPFVYRAIMQYKNGKEGGLGSWICESPSYSYVRLPGDDSGRFQTSASALFSDHGFSATSPSAAKSSSSSSSSATQFVVSAGVQSQRPHLNPPRVST